MSISYWLDELVDFSYPKWEGYNQYSDEQLYDNKFMRTKLDCKSFNFNCLPKGHLFMISVFSLFKTSDRW